MADEATSVKNNKVRIREERCTEETVGAKVQRDRKTGDGPAGDRQTGQQQQGRATSESNQLQKGKG